MTPAVTPNVQAPADNPTLAQRVRTKFPGEYDDMDDYTLENKVLAKYPEYSDLPRTKPPAPTASIGPGFQPQGTAGKIEQYASDLGGDVRYGTGRTLLGRLLQKMGAPGTSSAPGTTGEMMASAPLGLTRMLQGGAELAQSGKRWQGTKDVVGGGLQASQIPASFMAPEAAEASSQLPGILSGKTAIQKAGQGFQQVMGAAKDVPVPITDNLSQALSRYQQLVDAGGSRSLSVSKLLSRVTDPAKGALTYGEARDFASNISRLSADEYGRLTPVMQRQVGAIREALNEAVGQAASTAGKGEAYQGAMQGYRQGMQRQEFMDLLKNGAVKAVKYGLPTGVGATAGGYIAGKMLGLKK